MFYLSNLEKKDVFIDIPETDINGIVFHILKNSMFPRKKDAFREIIDREQLATTSIGNHVAMPHCRLKDFSEIYVKFAMFKNNLGYIAPNGQEIRFVFLIVGPEDDTTYYLRSLIHIKRIIKNSCVQKELLQAEHKKQIIQILSRHENKLLEQNLILWK